MKQPRLIIKLDAGGISLTGDKEMLDAVQLTIDPSVTNSTVKFKAKPFNDTKVTPKRRFSPGDKPFPHTEEVWKTYCLHANAYVQSRYTMHDGKKDTVREFCKCPDCHQPIERDVSTHRSSQFVSALPITPLESVGKPASRVSRVAARYVARKSKRDRLATSMACRTLSRSRPCALR